MSARKWLPSAWMDECIPTCGASPDDFLKRNADGVLQLTPINPADDGGWTPVDVLAGQEIEFCWHEDRGYATLVLREDGTWYCDPPFEGETNCISDDEGDIIADSIEDYVFQRTSLLCVHPGDVLGPGRHELDGWYWSAGTMFRVKVLESGAATFEEVAK